MTCQDIQEQLLTDFIDHEVPPEKKDGVERHLAGCASCREFLAAVRSVNDPLRPVRAAEPGPHVWANIRERIEAKPAPLFAGVRDWLDEVLWGFRPTFVYGSLVAAMCVVLVVPAGFYRQHAVAVAEKEELVQLVYADDDGSSATGAEMIGSGTLVEYWL